MNMQTELDVQDVINGHEICHPEDTNDLYCYYPDEGVDLYRWQHTQLCVVVGWHLSRFSELPA